MPPLAVLLLSCASLRLAMHPVALTGCQMLVMRLPQAHVLYSGADDSTLRGWDLRCCEPTTLFIDRYRLIGSNATLASQCLMILEIDILDAGLLHALQCSRVKHHRSA